MLQKMNHYKRLKQSNKRVLGKCNPLPPNSQICKYQVNNLEMPGTI